jgi:hypothetical protein
MPCAIAKVWAPLQQDDRIASKAVLVFQLCANFGWYAIAELVERVLSEVVPAWKRRHCLLPAVRTSLRLFRMGGH